MKAILERFADDVQCKLSAAASGEPEDQLRAPMERLLTEAGQSFDLQVIAKGESRLPGIGRPDYAVLVGGVLAGYIELKEPGKGANPSRYRGHDKQQWKRFKNLPNLVYTDGNEWTLFRNSESARRIRLPDDIVQAGSAAVDNAQATKLADLLRDFFLWEPEIPARGRELAQLLAPLTRMLRDEVLDALKVKDSSLNRVAAEWRELLFPQADNKKFADAFAQTVTYGLLLARTEDANARDLQDVYDKLKDHYGLLSRTLEMLTNDAIRKEAGLAISVLQRVIAALGEAAAKGSGQRNLFLKASETGEDPWLYFYEDFLAEYDPDLRKDAGVYYTPKEVVQAMVRLVDDALHKNLGIAEGLASNDALLLDPAVGTGTFLLGAMEQVAETVRSREGPGSVAARLTELASRMFGFENMVGPYAVSELRISQALAEHGAAVPYGGPNVFLVDTLEPPDAQPPQMGMWYEPLSKQHARANRVKQTEPILICIGNPPYDRHAADGKTGGWVRYDDGFEEKSILQSFIQPVKDAGGAVHLKNLYNLYVYFWRWALWKVFEAESGKGPGVACFISAASFIAGPAFAGMRAHLRELCDEVWVLDLGGEGRGARKSDNVFNIQTPVCITLAIRKSKKEQGAPPATVHYARLEGSRSEKLERLARFSTLNEIDWHDCPDDLTSAFHPSGKGDYWQMPRITKLFSIQYNGVQCKRIWPISSNKEVLKKRWDTLLNTTGAQRAELFKESGDRLISQQYKPIPNQTKQPAIATLTVGTQVPKVVRYAYRSFDRQWLIADARLIARPRPELWRAHGPKQLYLTSLLTKDIGFGPAIDATALIPDLDHFSGRGAKDVIPLFLDAAGEQANVAPALLEQLAQDYAVSVSPEDLAAYVYGVLACQAFTEQFAEELAERELRLPLTKDAKMFQQAVELGRKLIFLHTYGERFGKQGEKLPQGTAKCVTAVPNDSARYPEAFRYDEAAETLHVGAGRFTPVAKAIWDYEISGFRPVSSWLGYRMKERKGRKSSPLDNIGPETWPAQFTTELLELLWVLEHSLDIHKEQAKLLDSILAGPLFTEDELPLDRPSESTGQARGKKKRDHKTQEIFE